MSKKMWALVVVAGLFTIGQCSIMATEREDNARRDALSPAERATEDSARAAAARDAAIAAANRDKGRDAVDVAQFGLKKRARDPESMQFQGAAAHVRGDTVVVCGQVNSKNGFGGYTGFKDYVALNGAAIVTTDADDSRVIRKLYNELVAFCNSAPTVYTR